MTPEGEKLDRFLAEAIIKTRYRNQVPPMGRLADKLTQAAGVAKRASDRIEARADAIIAREAHISAREEAAFAPHEAILAGAEQGLTEVEAALNQLTNGGPPL